MKLHRLQEKGAWLTFCPRNRSGHMGQHGEGGTAWSKYSHVHCYSCFLPPVPEMGYSILLGDFSMPLFLKIILQISLKGQNTLYSLMMERYFVHAQKYLTLLAVTTEAENELLSQAEVLVQIKQLRARVMFICYRDPRVKLVPPSRQIH